MTTLLPRARLPERRIVAGVGLAVTAALLVVMLTTPPETVPVLVAGSDVRAAIPLAELDIEVRHVVDPNGAVTGSELGELADWHLSTPLAAGEPLIPSLLMPPNSIAGNRLGMELDSSSAAGGGLAVGDRVAVWVTWPDTHDGDLRTELVAESVPVASIVEDGTRVVVALDVDDDLVADLVRAKRGGDIDLVRSGT